MKLKELQEVIGNLIEKYGEEMEVVVNCDDPDSYYGAFESFENECIYPAIFNDYSNMIRVKPDGDIMITANVNDETKKYGILKIAIDNNLERKKHYT